MDVLDAARHLVQNYPGGAESLAPRLTKKSPVTLRHEVNPPQDSTAKLGLRTAVEMTQVSDDFAILNQFAADCNAIVLRLPANLDPDAQVAQQTAQLAQEFAELMGEIAVSTADRTISDNEMARIQRNWSDLVNAGQKLVSTFQKANADAEILS